jgi:hypothetical protein
VRRDLDHIDGDVATPKGHGQGEAGDTAADHQHFLGVAHGGERSAERAIAVSGWLL